MDRRDGIIDSCEKKWVEGYGFVATAESIKEAMDEYFEERAMELLEYLAKNKVICHSDEQGVYFNTRGETLTKEQIFENFL